MLNVISSNNFSRVNFYSFLIAKILHKNIEVKSKCFKFTHMHTYVCIYSKTYIHMQCKHCAICLLFKWRGENLYWMVHLRN